MAAADFEGKICDPRQFAGRAAGLPRPLVFTNGVFDILHRGHMIETGPATAFFNAPASPEARAFLSGDLPW